MKTQTAAERELYEERAAILEFDAGLSRDEAEKLAESQVWPREPEQLSFTVSAKNIALPYPRR